jgi:hypothetical protein
VLQGDGNCREQQQRCSDAEAEAGAALDALCGPVLYRALTGSPIPKSFIDGLIADVLERHPT